MHVCSQLAAARQWLQLHVGAPGELPPVRDRNFELRAGEKKSVCVTCFCVMSMRCVVQCRAFHNADELSLPLANIKKAGARGEGAEEVGGSPP